MGDVVVSLAPRNSYRLRWFDGATLIATEIWSARNSSLLPLNNLRGRVIRLEGLSTVFQTAPADPLLIEIEARGEGMPLEVAERIGARYSGIDTSHDWNTLKLVMDDEAGNERVVKITDCSLEVDRGRSTVSYRISFFIVEKPAAIHLR